MSQKKSIFKRWWFWVIVGVVLLSLIVGGTSDSTEPSETGTTKISTLQIQDNSLTLKSGQNIERYFKASASGDLAESDLKFISEDESIATVSFKNISLKEYVYFTVEGHKEGTTYIHFESADGSVISDKITVTVTANPNKTETSSTNTTDKNSTISTDKTSDKPASSSTQKPETSDTGTTNDTPASTNTQTSNSNTPQNSNNEQNQVYVWIPNSREGKYHRTSDCSGMKDPIRLTKEEAIAQGFQPCQKSKCYG